MRRHSIKALLFVFVALLILLSLSKEKAQTLRSYTVKLLSGIKPSAATSNQEDILQRTQVENQLLKAELQHLREQLGERVHAFIELDTTVLAARVIFRSPVAWDNTLWVNVGQSTNNTLGKEILAKNSPVVVGQSVIGVVDYVGEKHSRIRLITDAGLTPSVRAQRLQGKTHYHLAKGELQGRSKPCWRRDVCLLKGIGFNYDFPDDQGPARDLRTGKSLDSSVKVPTLPLIKVGDLLVTTGLDGVFPPGLHVAKVTRILPLKEGDYYYEIEAESTVKNLDDLVVVFILPPIGFTIN